VPATQLELRLVRKAQGRFYTPAPIALRLAELALRPLLDAGTPLQVIDPACGDGAFLRAARAVMPDPSSSVLGVDRDPAACETCSKEGHDTLEADALLAALPLGFDAVLANPPYLSVKRAPFDAGERRALTARYRTARGQFDACALFVERALELLHPGGRYALLLPRAILANREHEGVRRILLQEGPPERVVDLGMAFEGVSVEVVGVIGQKRSERQLPSPTIALEDFAGRDRGHLSLAQWAELPSLRLPLQTNDAALELRARIARSPVTLSQVVSRLGRGIELGQKAPVLKPEPRADRRPVLRGRDVHAFRCDPPSCFVAPDDVPSRVLKDLALYQVPTKLFVRRVADRLLAAVDRSQALALNTLYCVQPKDGIEADALACVINSTLATFWWRQSFAGDDRLFPYVRAEQLAALPLPSEGLASLAPLGRRAAAGRASQGEVDGAVEDLFELDAAQSALVAVSKGHNRFA
jgi:SAM-dependent methyltransferase